MNRIIVDYKKLNQEIIALLVDKFPDGFSDHDIIEFKNGNGDYVECVEVKTTDTIYLVKINHKLNKIMEVFTDEEDELLDNLDFENE